MPLALVRSAMRLHHAAVGCGRLAQLAHLAEREVERPAGREEAARGLRALVRGVVVEQLRELDEAREIGFGVGGILDRMRAVEEVGNREVSAALLARSDTGCWTLIDANLA